MVQGMGGKMLNENQKMGGNSVEKNEKKEKVNTLKKHT